MPAQGPDIDAIIGARLREARVRAGLTQQQLAERMGLVYQQVSKLEHGRHPMHPRRLLDAARALGVPVSWFFRELEAAGESPPPPRAA